MNYLITNPDSFGDILLRQPLFTGLLDAGHGVAVLVRGGYLAIVRFLDPRIRVYTVGDVNPYAPSILDRKADVLRALDAAAEFNPDVLVVAPFQRTLIDLWAMERFSGLKTVGMKGVEVVYEDGVRRFRPTATAGDTPLYVPEDLREIEKNRRLLSLCLGLEVEEYVPRLVLDGATLQVAGNVLRQLSLEGEEFVVCTPGSTSLAVKQYPLDRYIHLLHHWSTTFRRRILLVGNREESEAVATIADGLSARGVYPARWIGDDTRFEVLLGLIASATAYFGNDTGTMHFAAALGKPVVAIFGGGTWPRFIPAAASGAAILQELPCYGCRWRCVFETALCIQGVQEAWVKQAIDNLERKKSKQFMVRSHDFKGHAMNEWVAEAKDRLQENRIAIEELSVALERAREVARNRETAAADARQETEAMRTEYLHLKQREENERAQAGALRKEVETLRTTNLALAESLKSELESRRTMDARIQDAIRQFEGQAGEIRRLGGLVEDASAKAREAERRLEESRLALAQSERAAETHRQTIAAHHSTISDKDRTIAGLEKALSDAKKAAAGVEADAAAGRKTIAALQNEAAANQSAIRGFEAAAAAGRNVVAGLEARVAALEDAAKADRRQIADLDRSLGAARNGAREVRETLQEFLPKLEEFHLSIRQQDAAIQRYEQALLGFAQSGWTRIGVAVRIPWLSRWYRQVFNPAAGGPVPALRKDEFEVPLSLKEHLRVELLRIVELTSSVSR